MTFKNKPPSRIGARRWQPPSSPPLRKRHAGRWVHHAPPRGPFLFIPEVATTTGRGHVSGGFGAWYASDSAQGVIAEVMRHFVRGVGVDPREIVRQFGTVHVDLDVLDAADPEVLESLRLSRANLVSDNLRIPQSLVNYAASAGLEGVILPSAALPEGRTLVVLKAGLAGVQVDSSVLSSCDLAELNARLRTGLLAS
jgi:RES domain-containing protein